MSAPPFPTKQGYSPAPPPYTEKQPTSLSSPAERMIVQDMQEQPNDYLPLAIFVTICCCLPVGIVGLMKSGEVQSRYNDGDIDGSLESSKSAKGWSIAGLISGIVMWVLAAVFLVVYLVLIVDKANGDSPGGAGGAGGGGGGDGGVVQDESSSYY